jgi:hypothetical protein
MRTTVDLPDQLVRQLKSTAALKGMKMKDLVQELLERGLQQPALAAKRGRDTPLPDLIPPAGRTFPPITNSEIFDDLLGIDEPERKDRSA